MNNLSLPEESNIENVDVNTGNNVTLFNDNSHTFNEVTDQLMLAIQCDERTAFRLVFLVDKNGSAIVFSGSIDECVRVSNILELIGLKTSISI